MTSKRTLIVDPDGKKTVIYTEIRGCGWWLGTFVLLLIVIGGAATVSPLLAIALAIVFGFAYVISQISDRRSP